MWEKNCIQIQSESSQGIPRPGPCLDQNRIWVLKNTISQVWQISRYSAVQCKHTNSKVVWQTILPSWPRVNIVSLVCQSEVWAANTVCNPFTLTVFFQKYLSTDFLYDLVWISHEFAAKRVFDQFLCPADWTLKQDCDIFFRKQCQKWFYWASQLWFSPQMLALCELKVKLWESQRADNHFQADHWSG